MYGMFGDNVKILVPAWDMACTLIAAAKPFVDAVIVADCDIIALCKEYDAPFHVSTQMNISNSTAVNFLKKQGAAW